MERERANRERAEKAEHELREERARNGSPSASGEQVLEERLAQTNRRWIGGIIVALLITIAAVAMFLTHWVVGTVALLAAGLALAELGPYVRGERSVWTWIALVAGVVAGLVPIAVDIFNLVVAEVAALDDTV